jgi:acetoin:2,6-dichlorophenolindophenol oxidoreductase subunit alpha
MARPEAMEIPSIQVDGMDIWATRKAAVRTVAQVRESGEPAFVEARTYRFVGHSRSDPGKYRPEGELDRWKERDPLVVAAQRLVELEVDPRQIAAIDDEVASQLVEVEAAALAAPFPEPTVYSEFAG